MRYYKYGKEIELNDGEIVTTEEAIVALAKALIKKGVLVKQDILKELGP